MASTKIPFSAPPLPLYTSSNTPSLPLLFRPHQKHMSVVKSNLRAFSISMVTKVESDKD